MRTLCSLLASAAMAIALSGCHNGLKKMFHSKTCNKPQMYSSSQSIAPIRVPAGIDAPDTHASLRIPALNEPAPPPRKPTDPCLDAPPLFAAPRPATKSLPSL